MARLNEDIRHESERGVILRVLIRRQLNWVPFNELKQQLLRGQGYPLTDDELRFHLAYLSDPGRLYIEIKPLRSGRQEWEHTLVRATARAVDLVDGRLPADAGVAF